jgi:FkbM family methyltransferase
MPAYPIKQIIEGDLPTIQILDIGAMPEGDDRYSSLVNQGLAQVTGFEPNPEQLQKLNARTGPYRYLPYFLGSGGPATFHIARYPGCSSLYEPDPTVIDLFSSIGAGEPGGNFYVVGTLPVETRRLDDISEVSRADYMKLDVQGAELDVLKHGTKVLGTTLVLETEVEFIPLYKKQPLFGDIQTFMAQQGFVLHKMIDVGGRAFRPFVFNRNPRI